MDVQTTAFFIVIISVISVNRNHREDRNEHQALAQHVGQADIVGIVVVGCQRQHAARHLVHNIVRGRLHNDVAREVGRQRPSLGKQRLECLKLSLVRQSSEQQQICGLFVSLAAVLQETAYQVFDIIASITQFARNGYFDAIHLLAGNDGRNIGQSGQHAHAVQITQSALHIIFPIEFGRYIGMFTTDARQCLDLRCNRQHSFLRHSRSPPFVSHLLFCTLSYKYMISRDLDTFISKPSHFRE